jgi:hypothetical protein
MSNVQRLVVKYEIVDHGLDTSDYFQGCGVALTKYDECATGVGDSKREAARDAMEQLAHLPELFWNPAVITECDKEIEELSDDESETNGDLVYFVSIRVGYIT